MTDPVILQPASIRDLITQRLGGHRVMTSLCLAPMVQHSYLLPSEPRHAVWTVGMCLWSRGGAHILG